MTTKATFRYSWFRENFGFEEKDTFNETREWYKFKYLLCFL